MLTEVFADLPCHHPAWPRYCPRCRKLAAGVYVTKRSGGLAFPRDVMACIDCKLVMIEATDWTHPLYPRFNESRAAVASWAAGCEVVEVEAPDFDFCREGPGTLSSAADAGCTASPGPSSA